MRSQLKRLAHSHSRLFSLAPTQAHSEVFFTHMLWRLPALWEGLPFYLQLSTQRMTDDHLRHLSGAIVHAPYRTGPSSRRVDSSILLILLLPPHPFCGAAGFFFFFIFFWVGDGWWWKGGAPHAVLLSLPLETDTSPFGSLEFFLLAFLNMNSQIKWSPGSRCTCFYLRIGSLKLFNCWESPLKLPHIGNNSAKTGSADLTWILPVVVHRVHPPLSPLTFQLLSFMPSICYSAAPLLRCTAPCSYSSTPLPFFFMRLFFYITEDSDLPSSFLPVR